MKCYELVKNLKLYIFQKAVFEMVTTTIISFHVKTSSRNYFVIEILAESLWPSKVQGFFKVFFTVQGFHKVFSNLEL